MVFARMSTNVSIPISCHQQLAFQFWIRQQPFHLASSQNVTLIVMLVYFEYFCFSVRTSSFELKLFATSISCPSSKMNDDH